MAVVRWALLALVLVIALGTWWRFVLAPDPSAGSRPDRYYCPMHPQIRSADPGTCPICYMSLEPIPDRGAQPAHAGALDAGPEDEHEDELAPVMLTTERRQRAGIATVPARLATIEGAARWPASVEATEGARGEVRVRADAFVERITIREANVRVRAGQTLAWVYSPEILRAQEELLVAHRWSAGAAGGAPAALAQTQAAARARLVLLGMSARDVDAMLESGTARRTIPVRAPIGGTVTRFEAVLGSYATPETLLYEITDFSRVRVVATPLTAELAWLGPDAVARFEARGAEAAVPLRFELVEPSVTEPTRASRVRFLVAPGSAATLRPGEIGEVVVMRPSREAIVVPRDAVIDTGERRYVFVERAGGLFEPRVVELGALHDDQRIVTRGLDAGERVVARGAFVLDSESRLEAALAPAEAPAAHDHDAEGTP